MNYYLRRLQKVKTGSYMISIPSSWVKLNDLSPHDYLIVIEKPDHIIIRKRVPKAIAIINMDEVSDINTLMYIFNTYYIHGSSIIRIVSSKVISSNVRQEILNRALKLIGIRVSELSHNSIIFEVEDNIETFDDAKFIENIKRFITNIILIFNNLKILLGNIVNDLSVFDEIFDNIENLESKYKYLVRLLSRMSAEYEYNVFNSLREVIDYVLMLRDLERLVYHVNKLITHVKSAIINKIMPKIIYEVLLNVIDNMIIILNLLNEYLTSGDIHLLSKLRNEINNVKEMLVDKTDYAAETEKYGSYATIANILYEVRRILGYYVAIMDDISQLYLIPRGEF